MPLKAYLSRKTFKSQDEGIKILHYVKHKVVLVQEKNQANESYMKRHSVKRLGKKAMANTPYPLSC